MRRRSAFLFVVAALGLALRLSGLSFGLPYHHHWDEGWIVDSAAGMLRHHDGVPASYQYGAPLMRLAELTFLAMQWLRGDPGTLSNADVQTTMYLAARLVTAILSATGIVAVYLSARRPAPAPEYGAVAAAALYAVAPQLVMHSRYAVTDGCLVAGTAWTLAAAAVYLRTGRTGWGLATASAAGVTFAFKAPGVMTSVVPLGAALILYVRAHRARAPRRGHAIVLAATMPLLLVTYVLLNPHIIDHSQHAMSDLVGRYKQTRDGGFSSCYLREPGLPHLVSALWAIATAFLSPNRLLAALVFAAAVTGLVRGVRQRDPICTVAGVYAVCLVLSVALPNRTFLLRNYIVVVPALSLGFGRAVERAGEAVKGTTTRALLGGAAALLVFGPPIADGLGAERREEDPRRTALEWIARHTPPDATAMVAVSPAVFVTQVVGGYPELRSLLRHPNVRIAEGELTSCPPAEGGPEYVLDATYRDAAKAPTADPWQPLWLFHDCPGYDEVASFEASPYEADLRAYPTWPGRTAAIVLRSRSAP